ncbi:MAG: Nif3-like dinuclear metal center hexameric protein [Phycisphaerales bacterium]|jgi:dinuclear metal center YbgI/SA1388 family protein|nr:Nif3-like dinuclear metal center hexameric protein [Phycisphaerales bacterium]|tara:strand:- start:89099 stop:90250 length:1152 start_codon:yes stop_codon:yes gene_type:complete
MNVRDLMDAMERIAPLKYAESWDKVGLQLGVADRAIGGPIMLTIDLTEEVLAEALAKKIGAIVAYHPPLWEPLTQLTDKTHTERIIRGAAEAGIAIYSPHTALDATSGGVTDWLCEGIGSPRGESKPGVIAGDCRALSPAAGGDKSREVKVITFVPRDDIDHVRNALGTAGAGGLGKYKLCSFSTRGEGTFLPGPDANPTVGECGKLVRADEARLEMVCERRALPLVIETLKQLHPYEEPAYDIVELIPEPLRREGSGRRLTLDQPATMGDLIDRLKLHLGRSRMRYALAGDDRPFRTIGVVPGSGASLVELASRERCEVFITGEMTHHQITEAKQSGISVLLAGHTNTERGYLPRLKEKLEDLCSGTDIMISEKDRDYIVVG